MQENLIPETNQEELEVKVEVEETTSEPTVQQEEVIEWSITQDEYNKHLQSASSKAKNELLKEIGGASVAEIKELISKGAGVDEFIKELELAKQENQLLKSEKKESEDNELLNSLKIPKEQGELFLKLVDEDTSDSTRGEKARKVKSALLEMLKNETLDVKIGTSKTASEEKTYDEIMEKFQNL